MRQNNGPTLLLKAEKSANPSLEGTAAGVGVVAVETAGGAGLGGLAWEAAVCFSGATLAQGLQKARIRRHPHQTGGMEMGQHPSTVGKWRTDVSLNSVYKLMTEYQFQ